MATIIFRVLAILSIAGGFVMSMNGFPEGNTLIKLGIAVIIVSIAVNLVHIPRNSRGTF